MASGTGGWHDKANSSSKGACGAISIPVSIRTVRDAARLIHDHGIVTLVPAGCAPNIVTAVAGGAVRGSWQKHAKGKLIYRIGQALQEDPDVLTLKLVQGKVTFVAERLFPVVYRVVMHAPRRRRSLDGLGAPARSALEQVEREKRVRCDLATFDEKAKEALELRLLVMTKRELLDTGKHVTVLRSWKSWASAAVKEGAAELTYEDAIAELRQRAGEENLGPWISG